MHTQTFRRVTKALKQILPKGQEGDPREVQAVVFELIPANSMGYIKFQGILWRAWCPQQISLEPGMRVRVLDREHLTLIVEPIAHYVLPFNLTAQASPYVDS
jgi:membrane protein implicated in regulation of membrane protease activity